MSKITGLCVLLAVVLMTPVSIVHSQPVDLGQDFAQLEKRWDAVVIGGFDHLANSLAGVFSMVVFKERLYACALDFSPQDSAMWRTTDGLRWEEVGDGFDHTILVGPMVVFNDQLFAVVWNDALYQTTDGVQWDAIEVPFVGNNRLTRSFAELDGALYAGVWREEGGGEIWRSIDGSQWSMVVSGGFDDPANTGVSTLVSAFDALYAGVTNKETGAEVWRSFDGETWTQVNSDGFGDVMNTWISDLYGSPDGYIYAATGNANGAMVWRSPSSLSWEVVTGNAFGGQGISAHGFVEYDGWLWLGLSGHQNGGVYVWKSRDGLNWETTTPSGLGGPHNEAIMSIEVFDDMLYVGTLSDSSEEVWRLDTDFFAR